MFVYISMFDKKENITDIVYIKILCSIIYMIKTPFGNKNIIYADFAGSGRIDNKIEEYMNKNIVPYYSNTHSNSYCGRLMTFYIKQSKKAIRKSVNGNKDDMIIFTGNGCTGAVNHLIHILDLKMKTDPVTVIFVSIAEHHSNYLPWSHVPVKFETILIDKETGYIDMKMLEEKLILYKNNPKICSFTAGSNVTGVNQKVYDIASLVHRYDGLIFFDFAATAPYVQINMNHSEGYFDAIYISTHKFVGGPGCPGILIAKKDLFINNVPYYPGGGTVFFVCHRYIKYNRNPETKESGGTPNILGSIKAGLVFQQKDKKLDKIVSRNQEINSKVYLRLKNTKNLILLNHQPNNDNVPIYSFKIKELHYNYIVVLLNDLYGIQSRGGIACCSLYAQFLLNVHSEKQDDICRNILDESEYPSDYGWCRITFHYTMTDEIIEIILQAIEYVAMNGHKLLPRYSFDKESNQWMYKGFKYTHPIYEIIE